MILLKEFNAKIEMEIIVKPDREAQPTRTSKRQLPVEQANVWLAAYNLLVMSAMFSHEDIDKEIWVPTNGKTRNQVDHGITNPRYTRNILDVGR